MRKISIVALVTGEVISSAIAEFFIHINTVSLVAIVMSFLLGAIAYGSIIFILVRLRAWTWVVLQAILLGTGIVLYWYIPRSVIEPYHQWVTIGHSLLLFDIAVLVYLLFGPTMQSWRNPA